MRIGPSTPRLCLLALSGILLLPSLAAGFAPLDEDNRKAGLTALVAGGFGSEELEVQPSLEIEPRGSQKALAHSALQRFFAFQSDAWEVRWDTRGDRPSLIQGAGIPLLPGKGNKLKLAHEGGPDLKEVETRVRAFLADFPELLNVEGFDLRLDPASSINVGEEKQIWLVELQQFHHGVPVEGAKVFFRINNGNIVQLGTERIAEVQTSATPRIGRAAALAAAVQALGFRADDLAEIVDPGTLKFVPALTVGEHPAETYEGARGQGYRHFLVWEVAFRRAGDPATWQAKVDARTGRLLSLVDANAYATAQVTGGIYPVTNSDPEVVEPLPFVNVANGSAKVADRNGNYSYSGGLAMTNLSGRYIKIADQCGPVSKSDGAPGDIMLGTSRGTDCATPGSGGSGNPTPPAPATTI